MDTIDGLLRLVLVLIVVLFVAVFVAQNSAPIFEILVAVLVFLAIVKIAWPSPRR